MLNFSQSPVKKDLDSDPQVESPKQHRHDLSSISTASARSSGGSRDSPSWMQEAADCLLQEFITYMTRQMHFNIILSTLDDETIKLDHPYALLQRSVKMDGVHLIEVRVPYT